LTIQILVNLITFKC